MPRDGDAPLKRFVHAIVREDGFSLGSPSLSDDGATVIVPIVRTGARARRYVLACEAADAVSALDGGRIGRLRVRNDSDGLVLLPAGTVFAGQKTASRGTTAGLLLAPTTSRDIEVRCVEPSRPIRAGEELFLVPDSASLDVTQALLSGDQGLVWATVHPPGTDPTAGHPEIPPRADLECGRIVLDARGIMAAEVYDHPASWSAAGPRPPAPSAANPLGLNPAHAVSLAREFLEHLERIAFRTAGASSWVAADASAAFTLVGGEVAHLIAFGRDITERTAGVPPDTPAAIHPRDVSDPAMSGWSKPEGSDAEVAVASHTVSGDIDEPLPSVSAAPRRKKVLTSGWDAATFSSLERLSRKEFGGDRSAAIRALVRRGLADGGYLGPRSPPPMAAPDAIDVDAGSPALEDAGAALETRIREYERVAQTETYADWLRKRARLEAERLRGGTREGVPEAVAPTAPASPAFESPEEPAVPEEIEPETPPLPAPPPVDVRPLLRRAFAASAAARYPEALALFDDVLTAEPGNRTALLGRAVALRRSGKAQEALEALDAVLLVDPTNAAALLNRGRVLQERGDFEAALESIDRLSAVAPNDWDVWLVRGDVLAKMGRSAEALRAYSEARRRNPDDESLALRIRSLENAEAAQTPPPTHRVPLPRDVQEGQSYLIREARPSLSLRVLRALAARGVPALALSPRSPETVRRDIGITGVRVVELTHAPGEERHDPTALAALSHLTTRFVQQGRGHGVIALDGLGTLVQENGSRDTLLFIERVHEAVLQSHAVFLVSVAPGELSDRETALLERSLRSLA